MCNDQTNISRRFPGASLSMSVNALPFIGYKSNIYYIIYNIYYIVYNIYPLAFTSLIGEKVRDGERSLPYAFIASGGQIGLLLVGSFGSWIGHKYKWDLLFELIGIFSFIWIIFLYKINREYSRNFKYSQLGPSANKGIKGL